MIPDRNEWKTWSSKDKVEYFAQIAVLVTLLITVMFSFLSWREARVSSTIQRELFASENAPALVVYDTFIYGPGKLNGLTIKLRNIGRSGAFSICTSIVDPGNRFVFEGCKGNSTLSKGQSFSQANEFTDEVDRRIGFRPKFVGLATEINNKSSCDKFPKRSNLVVSSSYKDAIGVQHYSSDEIVVCTDE